MPLVRVSNPFWLSAFLSIMTKFLAVKALSHSCSGVGGSSEVVVWIADVFFRKLALMGCGWFGYLFAIGSCSCMRMVEQVKWLLAVWHS
ncbi:hypothetical protein Tco_1502025 [Tanacetum coccineum]